MKARLKDIIERSLNLTIDNEKSLSEYSVDSIDILGIIGDIEDEYDIELNTNFIEILTNLRIKDVQTKLDQPGIKQ